MILSKRFQKLFGIEDLESPIFITVCKRSAAYGTNNALSFQSEGSVFIKDCLSRRNSRVFMQSLYVF